MLKYLKAKFTNQLALDPNTFFSDKLVRRQRTQIDSRSCPNSGRLMFSFINNSKFELVNLLFRRAQLNIVLSIAVTCSVLWCRKVRGSHQGCSQELLRRGSQFLQ